jgi:hypothetical protein
MDIFSKFYGSLVGEQASLESSVPSNSQRRENKLLKQHQNKPDIRIQ